MKPIETKQPIIINNPTNKDLLECDEPEQPEPTEEEEEQEEPSYNKIPNPEPNNTFIVEDKQRGFRIEFNSNNTMQELFDLAIQTKIKLLDNNHDEK